MPVLVYIDHDNQNLNVANLSTITAASMIGEVHAVVIGYNCSDVAKVLIIKAHYLLISHEMKIIKFLFNI